ncbi:Molybdopterin converting factor, subunit 2 [Aphelenchoides bicaudatus]|nr:Molybdopterin converting factor, subunit 2 [Aphelenchoides bicaudatus]
MTGIVFGIGGCTNSGKSTLRERLKDELSTKFNYKIATLAQDDFFKEKQHVRQLKNSSDPNITFYNYDEAFAVICQVPFAFIRYSFSWTKERLFSEIQRLRLCNDIIIVDGNMITELPAVLNLFHTVAFVQLDYETYEIGYFDQVVWKAYEDHLNFARSLNDPRLLFVDGNDPQILGKLLNMALNAFSDQVSIQKEPIDVDKLCSFVTSPKCGGISVFIGTTRETFEEKTVKLLEYECYEEMALTEMRKLCHEARQQFPNVGRIAICHRIGNVPVCEKSVVIATSSPHRLDAIQATQLLIDRLKATVPIWKKEVYNDNQSAWKENAESQKRNR